MSLHNKKDRWAAERKGKRNSLQNKLLFMGVIPIAVLGVMITIFGMILLYRFFSQSIRDELASTTNVLIDCLNLTVRGDYSYKDDMLLKGNLNITDSTMLYRVKENSQIDTTIFWEDTRILTTVQNKYGISAVGTKANPELAERVLKRGETYFSNSVDVNGTEYIGYYVPLENSDHTVVGMVFAGKERRIVYNEIVVILICFGLFCLIALLIVVTMINVFSRRLVSDINGINVFLGTIAEGNLTTTLNERITKRNDEIGSIGMYASWMKSNIKKLIEMDPLTALFNRRSCKNMLAELEGEATDFCLVMCDIDWFKRVNDNFGHAAGDYVLVTISGLIRENVKDCGFASRWGGEEFLLVYRLDFEQTRKKVELLQQSVREYDFSYNDMNIRITMTFGVQKREMGDFHEEMIKKADAKLYIGKNSGRDKVVCEDEAK